MLTDKNPDFGPIADAVYYLTENRILIDAYQDYKTRQAYHSHRVNLIREQAQSLQEKDTHIAELEKVLAENRRSVD